MSCPYWDDHGCAQGEDLADARRLIRWLSLTYGGNEPILHGAGKESMLRAYRAALEEDDTDPDFLATREERFARPPPGPDLDFGDIDIPMIKIDSRGNTVTGELPEAPSRRRRFRLRRSVR